MKNMLKNVSFTFLILKSCLLFSQGIEANKVVVIDPGHGGNDPGAIGINEIQEKDVVLDIAGAISKLNKESDSPLEIYLTRDRDTLISLSDRTKIARALKANLFLSLHCNHSDNPNARGIEVYVGNRKTKFSDSSIWLAYKLESDFKNKLGFEGRGVKFANFQVLRETILDMPSVLLELGFLSNQDEYDYFLKPNSTKILAELIWYVLNKK